MFLGELFKDVILMMLIAPLPKGVAIAAMVSFIVKVVDDDVFFIV